MPTDLPELVSPIQPHEIPAKVRKGLEDMVTRITARSAVDGRGSDLLLRVYLAGLYHGMRLTEPSDAY